LVGRGKERAPYPEDLFHREGNGVTIVTLCTARDHGLGNVGGVRSEIRVKGDPTSLHGKKTSRLLRIGEWERLFPTGKQGEKLKLRGKKKTYIDPRAADCLLRGGGERPEFACMGRGEQLNLERRTGKKKRGWETATLVFFGREGRLPPEKGEEHKPKEKTGK